MEQPAMMSVQEGDEEPYVLFWPPTGVDGAHISLAFIMMRRPGGMLLAVPVGFIPMAELQVASNSDESALLGPHTVLRALALRQEDSGPVSMAEEIEVQIVDVSDQVLPGLVKYADSGVADDQLLGFAEDVSVMPDLHHLLPQVISWVANLGAQRAVFYSAAEEEEQPAVKATPKAKQEKAKRASPAKQAAAQITQMAELLPTIAAQLATLQENQIQLQREVRGVATTPPPRPSQQPATMTPGQFAAVVGAPPRTKGLNLKPPPAKVTAPDWDVNMSLQEQAEEAAVEEGGSPLERAMLRQSQALMALVSSMHHSDPLLDFQGTASSSLSSKGSMGREKLQMELSQRSGNFFLAVMQNMFRKLKPATAVPSSIEALAETDISALTYLERFGSFANTRDMGVAAYGLSFVMDAAMKGDLAGVREHLALLFVGMEQYAQDARWDLGFVLTLLEDPPPAMFSYRSAASVQTGRNRAFSQLCPQRWATVALAYMKELDYIQGRRNDTQKKDGVQQPQQPGLNPNPSPNPNPKRKARFPKAKPSQQPAQNSEFRQDQP